MSSWRHPKVETRINAVTKLNPDKPSDAKKLWLIATLDHDLEVRKRAVQQLNNPEQLFQLLGSNDLSEIDICEEMIQAVLCRLSDLYQSKQVTLAQLEQLNKEQLATLLCVSSDATLHDRFFTAIDAEPMLALLAMKGAIALTRQRAAAQVDQDDLLQQVGAHAKEHDKAVYKLIRQQQKDKQQKQLEQQSAQQACDELILQMSDLISKQDAHFEARYHHLLQHWSEVSDHATDKQQEAFTQAQGDIQHLLLQHHELQQQEAEKQALTKRSQEQLQDLENQVHEILLSEKLPSADKLGQVHTALHQLSSHLPSQDLETLAVVEQALNSLLTLVEEQASFHQIQAQIDQSSTVEELASSMDQLAQFLQPFKDWPTHFALPAQLKLCRDQLVHLKKQRTDLEAQQHQAQELQQQQQQAIIAEKELLCVAMEALIDIEMPATEKAQQVRRLQQQWKELDQQANSSIKPLWDRFHHASQDAYAPCEQHFKEQSKIRAWNLSQREQICELLEAYYDSLDWSNPDWQAVEHILKKAKKEWRDFSPVDRAPGKAVQERFNQLLNHANTHLNQYRQECAQAKQDIVDEATQLASVPEADFAIATQRFKELQQGWKAIGSAEHKQERHLWKAFREQGDLLFSRLGSHQQQQRSQEEQEARLLCVRLEILLNQPSPEADQYLRMEYQMERLEQALETPTEEEQYSESARLKEQWRSGEFDIRFPELNERFQQLLDSPELGH